MLSECAIAVTPVPTRGLALKTLWHVDADRTYDVRCRRPDTLFVAVRTLDGAGEMTLASDANYELSGNSFFVVRQGDIRRYRCADNRWHFHWFEFTMCDSSDLLLGAVLWLAADRAELSELEKCFALLRRNLRLACLRASVYLEGLIARSILEGRRMGVERTVVKNPADSAIEIMREHLSGMPLDDIAAAVFLSSRRFRTVFERATGVTPKKFYNYLRLDTAAEWLRQRQDTMEAISMELGFSSPAHFSRAFTQRFGIPPSRYAIQAGRVK